MTWIPLTFAAIITLGPRTMRPGFLQLCVRGEAGDGFQRAWMGEWLTLTRLIVCG